MDGGQPEERRGRLERCKLKAAQAAGTTASPTLAVCSAAGRTRDESPPRHTAGIGRVGNKLSCEPWLSPGGGPLAEQRWSLVGRRLLGGNQILLDPSQESGQAGSTAFVRRMNDDVLIQPRRYQAAYYAPRTQMHSNDKAFKTSPTATSIILYLIP